VAGSSVGGGQLRSGGGGESEGMASSTSTPDGLEWVTGWSRGNHSHFEDVLSPIPAKMIV
jgi:hypothetical protein